ncbi:MAG: class I SAM-dependent methyltransferase [Bacteriovorax sp.]|nr:class I SAM-dependent methyltransferase [Bacteriovorax sp.]
MHSHSKLDSFGKDRAKSYDQSNNHIVPIYENLHYLIKILLSEVAPNSKILCIGVGTGSEIIELAEAFPKFTFVAVDPSESMLEVCREKLKKLNLLDRCELIHGYVEDVQELEGFDGALCLLVLHHTTLEDRTKIITGIFKCLKTTGYFICAEISFDLTSSAFGDIIEKWQSMIRRSGSQEGKIQNLPRMMKEHLFIQAPSEVELILVSSGFLNPIQFFQALLIRAWYARK